MRDLRLTFVLITLHHGIAAGETAAWLQDLHAPVSIPAKRNQANEDTFQCSCVLSVVSGVTVAVGCDLLNYSLCPTVDALIGQQ